jgi:hypothetical protein
MAINDSDAELDLLRLTLTLFDQMQRQAQQTAEGQHEAQQRQDFETAG